MYITQGLHRSLIEAPDRIATICGDRQRTFAELGDRIARFADALHTVGVASGDRVAILSLNSDRYLEYLFGVPWADAVLNPINTRWSAQEVAYCLNDSDSRVLLVDDAMAPHVPALREQCPQLRTVIHVGDGATPDGMLAYEDLLAAATPIPDVPPRRRQPGRSLLHGRHHRVLQGRDAQPHEPGDVGDGLHRHRRVRVGRRHLPARRADVPRRRPGRRLRWRARRRHPRHRPRVRPEGGARRHLRARRHRHAPRADDDPAPGRPPRSWRSTTSAACATSRTAVRPSPRRCSSARRGTCRTCGSCRRTG